MHCTVHCYVTRERGQEYARDNVLGDVGSNESMDKRGDCHLAVGAEPYETIRVLPAKEPAGADHSRTMRGRLWLLAQTGCGSLLADARRAIRMRQALRDRTLRAC